MNDIYEKGFQDGKELGYKDGFARGWHEAMRLKAEDQKRGIETASSLNRCPKCNITYNGSVTYICQSWACPMEASSTSKSIHGET